MRHIRELDGARGLLALWVFVAHALELGPYTAFSGHLRAYLAVDIFIILSGFVIFHLLSQGEDYGTFVTRRFFRLFPVFAVCFLFALVLRAATNSQDVIAFAVPNRHGSMLPYLATHAALVHGMVPDQWLPLSSEAVLPPAWSISVEWQFYLIAPLLFALTVRPRWTLAMVVIFLLTMRLLVERHSLGILLPGAPRDLTFTMNAFLPLKIEFFAIGVLSWALWRKLSAGSLKAPAHLPWLAALGAPLVWCATGSLPLGLWTALFLCLVDAQFGQRSGVARAAQRLLNARITRFLGLISYPFYLVHLPVVVLVRHELMKHAPGLAATPAHLAALLVALPCVFSLALAWVLHVTVEKPFMTFAKKLTARWHAAGPAHAPAPLTVQSSSQ